MSNKEQKSQTRAENDAHQNIKAAQQGESENKPQLQNSNVSKERTLSETLADLSNKIKAALLSSFNSFLFLIFSKL
jgi:uncharacterized FlaG/YvyC family protein